MNKRPTVNQALSVFYLQELLFFELRSEFFRRVDQTAKIIEGNVIVLGENNIFVDSHFLNAAFITAVLCLLNFQNRGNFFLAFVCVLAHIPQTLIKIHCALQNCFSIPSLFLFFDSIS